jgi:hypothetical protein
MQSAKFGRIINVSSGAGLYGNFGQANYGAAKLGILGLTQTLAKEGEKHNIRVNCIVPVAESKMTATVLPKEVLDLLHPQHISPLVTYLAHDSCQPTGAIFELGGGWFSQVRWQRSRGIKLSGENSEKSSAAGEFATAEQIAANIDRIGDFSEPGVSYPLSAGDALQALASMSAESPKQERKGSESKSDEKNTSLKAKKLASDEMFNTLQRYLKESEAKY